MHFFLIPLSLQVISGRTDSTYLRYGGGLIIQEAGRWDVFRLSRPENLEQDVQS